MTLPGGAATQAALDALFRGAEPAEGPGLA